MKVRLDAIAFDAGTQIRASIDQQLVTDYAEAMTEGAQFPAIVLFHDGNQHYLADGFHRFMAAQRLTCADIDAEVRPGTKEDALWFALGANRTNGKRLTQSDVKHAIEIAVGSWPDKSAPMIAAQIGCSSRYVTTVKDHMRTTSQLPDRITGQDGKSYPAKHEHGPGRQSDKYVQVEALVRAGVKSSDIAKQLNAHPSAIARARKAAGLSQRDQSREGVRQRREQMRDMAVSGYTSRQIAAKLGLREQGCRTTLRAEGIDVPADKAVGKIKHHDANRIVDRIVMDATNLTEGVSLIDFSALDRERLGEWADSLIAARRALDGFIKRLVKEQHNVTAA